MPPDPRGRFIIQVGSSDYGWGSVRIQVVDGKERTIAYASKKLLPRERNRSVIQKQLDAIVWSLQKFANYVYARELEVQTDHKSLGYLISFTERNSRVARFLTLQKFNIRTTHRADNVRY